MEGEKLMGEVLKMKPGKIDLDALRAVIDGDLCELFGTLPSSKQKEIAEELDATPKEVLKYIDEMRTKCYV